MRKKLLALMMIGALIITTTAGMQTLPAQVKAGQTTQKTMKGVWIATVGNIDFPSKQNLSVSQMKKELDKIVNMTNQVNLNSIFFQVRPTCDAMYKSKIFPWSKYLTGKQGKAPAGNFDPLAYLINAAAKKNIDVHAWINPYRVTNGTLAKPEKNLNKLHKNNPARKNPGIVIKHTDGKMYLDPGQPKSRDIVVEGVKELVKNYKIAGIHFDDYFYPGTKFNDSKSYKKYGKGKKIGAWRRSNVNQLVSKVKAEVHKIKPNVQFGISPAGVWANKGNNKLGSATRGAQSYYEHYADTRKWVKQNMVDYIAPQIYWEIGFPPAAYDVLVKWWSNVAKGTNTKLYIGHALYKMDKKSSSKIWRSAKPIKDQLNLNKKYPQVTGSIFYGFDKIKKNTFKIQEVIKSWAKK